MPYRDSTLTTATGTSVNGTKPATLKTGDRMLAYYVIDAGFATPPTITPPAGQGWTLVTGSNQGNNSGAPDGFCSFLYTKIAGASEGATYNFAHSGSSTDLLIIIACFSGRDLNPNNIIVRAPAANSTSNATPVTVSDATGITPDTNADIAVFATADITINSGVWSSTPPSNYTERQDGQLGFSTGTLATRDEVFLGNTGTISLTYTRTSGTGNAGWGLLIIALPVGVPDRTARPRMVIPKMGLLSKRTLIKPWSDGSVVVDTLISTETGLLVIDGFAPTVTITSNVTVETGLGQLTLTGFSLQVNLKINTDVGALTLTGFAPQVNQKINTDVGALLLAGFAPTVSVSNNITVATGAGALTLTGFAPQVNQKINTNTGQLVITGFSPTVTVSNHQTVFTDIGQLTIDGFAPNVNISNNITIQTGTGQLVLTGFAPSTGDEILVVTGTGQLIITGFAPTISTETILIILNFETDITLETKFETEIVIPANFETGIELSANFD